MRYLALDIGTRRTGVAYGDDQTRIPFALETIWHETVDALVDAVTMIARERGVTRLVIGLPLLPGGGEGSQAALVRNIAVVFRAHGFRISFIDERYTTEGPQRPRHVRSVRGKGRAVSPRGTDSDAASACHILAIFWGPAPPSASPRLLQ